MPRPFFFLSYGTIDAIVFLSHGTLDAIVFLSHGTLDAKTVRPFTGRGVVLTDLQSSIRLSISLSLSLSHHGIRHAL
jgi:hypothetical protein